MTDRFQYIAHIADLIVAEITGKIHDEEREELERWKNESPENFQLYTEYHSVDFVADKFKFVRVHDVHGARKELLRRMERETLRVRRVRFYRYASVVVLFILLGGIFIFTRENKDTSIYSLTQGFEPGSSKAILTKPDGQKVDISNVPNLTYVPQEFVAGDSLPDVLPGDTLRLCTITIPRGGEFSLILSDGSILKMNSESEIRFPEKFNGDAREVYMKGEVYFQVARNTISPFIVHTCRGDIKVLGTSFNVRDYQDENFLETTLVSGQIAFNRGGEDIHLRPKEQLRLNKKNGEMMVKTVDVRLFSSWKEGRFVFEKQRIEDIMNTLSRWYNVRVFYEDSEVKDILFTGNMKRYNNLNQMIDLLELVNKVSIRIDKDNIYIKSNR